ncbi:transposase [Rugamonas sp.]|uniref:transposase n=1 Tax=Rugamonas sp. TaxID=1926287 RepID=UPI002600A31B|nr:transposase [Rugamonas sp.]
MAALNDEVDTPWKLAVTRYFPAFMAFYFPQAHAAIDWSRPHVFLDEELAQLTRDAALGKRLLDKLVRVHALDGGAQWVLIHIEVQGGREHDFAERIFSYNYRAYDRYRRPVASLVVLADDGARWRPQAFSYRLFGCEMRLDFAVVKLRDYAARIDELLGDPNPFALVTVAHLLTRKTRGDAARRHAEKWRLARLLFLRNWDKQSIIDLYLVIDWMMRLPAELEQRLWRDVAAWERKVAMRHISSIERIGMERGRKIGREEGVRVGIKEGHEKGLREGERKGERKGALKGAVDGKSKLLAHMLSVRFDYTVGYMRKRLAGATGEQLDRWAIRLLTAASLDEVFRDH